MNQLGARTRSLPVLPPWATDVSLSTRLGGTLALLVTGGALAVAADSATSWTVVAASMVGAVITLSWNEPQRLAWLAGALLPIQAVDRISSTGLEVIHIALIGVVVVRFAPRLSRPTSDLVVVAGALLAALALTRLGFGLARDAALPTVRFAGLTVAALTAATLVAFRVDAHRSLLTGFLAGATASATVTLMQLAGLEWIRTGFYGENRYPGLALEAPGLSWHMVIALMIGLAAVTTSDPGTARRATWLQMTVCALALLTCGAQGGLAGLGFAALVCATSRWRDVRRVLRARPVVAVAALAVTAAALVVGAALGLSSVAGLAGDSEKGFANELARVRSIRYGVEQLVDHPLTGAGVVGYDARYDVRPHFLPLDAGVNTGGLGVLIGAALVGLLIWVLLQGPAGRTTSCLLGLGLLSAMLIQTLLTPSGPFASVERISLFMIAVAALRGASVPFPRSAPPAPTLARDAVRGAR